MTDRPLTHGFSVRAVVREAAGDYVSRFWLLLVAALAVFIPAGLIEAATNELLHWIGEDVSPGAITAAIAGALATTITATLGDVFYTGVVAAIVAEGRGGVRHGLADIARRLPYGRLLAVDLLFALFVGVGILLLIIPGDCLVHLVRPRRAGRGDRTRRRPGGVPAQSPAGSRELLEGARPAVPGAPDRRLPGRATRIRRTRAAR